MAFLVFVVGGLVPGAVVRGVDDEGVVAEAEAIEGIEEAAGFKIEFFDNVAVEAGFGFAEEVGRGVDDGVHHGVREIENEGAIRVSIVSEEVDGFVGVECREAAHIVGIAGGFVVFMEVNGAVVVGAEGSEVVVEALGVGHAFDDGFAVGDVPFSDADGLVSEGLHEFGPGDFVGGHAPTFGAVGVAAGEEGGA